MKKTTDYLISLGLTKIEAIIYEGLLQTGPSTIKELSEFLRLKRITTHFNVESLIEKGLIVQTMQGARRKIMTEEPKKIKYILDRKERNIEQLKNDFPDIVKTLENSIPLTKPSSDKVEVKYYEGKNGLQLIYDDVLKANELRSYVNSKEIAKIFPNNVNLFITTHNKNKNMQIWEIMNKSSIFSSTKYSMKMAKDRYFVKYVPETMNLSVVDYMIYDGKVAIVNIRENPTGLIIINKDYYENAKEIFNFVWKMLPT